MSHDPFDPQQRLNSSFSSPLYPTNGIKSAGYLRKEQFGPYARCLDCYALVYLMSGSGTYADQIQHITVNAGNLIILFPGMPHCYGPGPDETWYESFLIFDSPLIRAYEENGLLSRNRPCLLNKLDPALTEGMNHLVERFIHNVQMNFREDESNIHQLLVQHTYAEENKNQSNTFLYQAKMLLSEKVEMRMCAKSLGVSYQVFRKRFQKESGLSPKQFVMQQRFSQSRQMLLDGIHKINDIADHCGFSDIYQFSRLFKKHHGISPKRYRTEHGV